MAKYDPELARRWGADAYDGARDRQSGGCFVVAEMVFLGLLGGVYSAGAHDLSTPTAIAVGVIIVLVGLVLTLLPVIGLLFSLVLSAAWGLLAGAIATALGNQLLGIVVGIVVGLIAAGLHLGYRR